MPSVVILSHVIGFNHADLAGAEKEPLSSAAGLRTKSRPCKAPSRPARENLRRRKDHAAAPACYRAAAHQGQVSVLGLDPEVPAERTDIRTGVSATTHPGCACGATSAHMQLGGRSSDRRRYRKRPVVVHLLERSTTGVGL
jgi:hypothetical protein